MRLRDPSRSSKSQLGNWTAFACLLVTGCSGDVDGGRTAVDPSAAGTFAPVVPGGAGGPPGSVPPGAQPSSCSGAPADNGEAVLRRLSGLEYQLTLQDLFQLPAPPSLEGMPADTLKDGFKTFAEVQTVSAQHLRAYLDKAVELNDALWGDAARRSKVLGCAPEAADCLRAFVTRFGRLAYRRPLEAAEVDGIASRAERDAVDVPDRFRFATEVMLTSANFLYRVEIGSAPEGLSTLTPLETASKLSFAIWGRAPSAQLLDQAAQPGFAEPESLRRQAETMLRDSRAQQFFAAFFRQWLGFDTLRAPVAPPRGWSDALLTDMQAETDQLLQQFAWGGKPLLDVLTTNEARMTPALARYHGLPAPAAGGSVAIPATSPRAFSGVLSHPSLLSAKTDGDAIAIRGNWLRRTFLCEHLEIPPAVAEELGELLAGLTRVQIVARRNSDGACKGCHATIDPIGIGLSSFDSTGRFDASVNIDQYGIAPALPGAPDPGFRTVAELSAKLRALPRVPECVTDKVFMYVNGRDKDAGDTCAVENSSRAFLASDLSFPALVQALVTSPEFRLRRAPTAGM